eukprot:CAMPEP_0197589360 /NCGR_PEP_ID=MMETSP1326-20131121/10335_1 /TAXON_ID=1155430 /ORGANISM="Genus nov. species nov., Strain RCC2288" /LENGTH=172 /DNA_ID=CAMNT_0043154285 /DNA_START=18 /DNA_END=532 /DNA_ORIENTATION=+
MAATLPPPTSRRRRAEPRTPARVQDGDTSDKMAAILLSAAPLLSAPRGIRTNFCRSDRSAHRVTIVMKAPSAVAAPAKRTTSTSTSATSTSATATTNKVTLLAAAVSAALVALPAFAEEAAAAASTSAEISPFAGVVDITVLGVVGLLVVQGNKKAAAAAEAGGGSKGKKKG